jgi:hypothetical protein
MFTCFCSPDASASHEITRYRESVIRACDTCGLGFTDPPPGDVPYEDEDFHLVTKSPPEANSDWKDYCYGWAYRCTLGFIRKALPTGGKIMDIGCGEGTFLRILNDAGYATVGLDRAAAPWPARGKTASTSLQAVWTIRGNLKRRTLCSCRMCSNTSPTCPPRCAGSRHRPPAAIFFWSRPITAAGCRAFILVAGTPGCPTSILAFYARFLERLRGKVRLCAGRVRLFRIGPREMELRVLSQLARLAPGAGDQFHLLLRHTPG